MVKFNVIGYDNQKLGEVEAVDVVDAWSKAGEKFENILDIREYTVPKWMEILLPPPMPPPLGM